MLLRHAHTGLTIFAVLLTDKQHQILLELGLKSDRHAHMSINDARQESIGVAPYQVCRLSIPIDLRQRERETQRDY